MASNLGAGRGVTDGLIFYVDVANPRSYVGSGTTTTNIGKTTSTASLVNGVGYSSDYGGSFVFDGTNDYISCGDTDFQISGPNLSIEVVFYHDGTDKTNMPIFAKRRSISNYRQFGLGVNNGNFYAGGTGKVLNMFLRPDEALDSGPPDPKDRGCTYTLPSAGIYHVIGVNDNTSARLWVNGVIVSETTSSQSQNNFTISGYDMRIGNNNASSYMTGSVYLAKLYNRTLTTDEILQNYESTRERFSKRGIGRDSDAVQFLRTVGITDETQQSAIDNLVIDLKNAGLWSKMKAIYPFVGGTASTHKWNLKDPRDLDAAFRLTFNGGWVHSSTGAKPNGTTGYANTYWNSTNNGSTSGHMSFYSRTNNSENSVDMGSQIQSPDSYTYLLQFSSTLFVRDTRWCETAAGNTRESSITNTSGYIVVSRRSASDASAYRNGIKTVSNSTNVSPNTSTVNIVIGARNFNGSIDFYSSRECAFSTIGDGLTDAELSTLYTIVQTYQTTLGRQV